LGFFLPEISLKR